MEQDKILAKVEAHMRHWSAEDLEITVRGITLGGLVIRVSRDNKDCDIEYLFKHGTKIEDHLGFWLEIEPQVRLTIPSFNSIDIDKFDRNLAFYAKVLTVARKLESLKEKSRDFISSHSDIKKNKDRQYLYNIVSKDSKSLRVGAYRVSKDSDLATISPGDYTILVGDKVFSATLADTTLTFTRIK